MVTCVVKQSTFLERSILAGGEMAKKKVQWMQQEYFLQLIHFSWFIQSSIAYQMFIPVLVCREADISDKMPPEMVAMRASPIRRMLVRAEFRFNRLTFMEFQSADLFCVLLARFGAVVQSLVISSRSINKSNANSHFGIV